MRRRIGLAVALTTGLALLSFGAPLAAVIALQYRDAAVLELEGEATHAAQAVPASALDGTDPVELPAGSLGATLSVYDTGGSRLAGEGPAVADEVVRSALDGQLADRTSPSKLIVAVPLSSDERVYAALRAELPASRYRGRVLLAWLLMSGFGLGLVLLAALVTRAVAARVARPVDRLVGDAERLGTGTFALDPVTTGIAEIDRAHAALVATAARVGEVLARERSFSAEVSHQLLTPLTALRLDLEALDQAAPEDENIADALRQCDHLEQTVADMLALARDLQARPLPIQLEPHLRRAAARWNGALAAAGRPLRLVVAGNLAEVRTSPPALGQILEVLLANALHHGAGEVTIRAHETVGAVAVDVIDDGAGFGPADPFAPPGSPDGGGGGRGLRLARRLAQADGADLRIVHRGPRPTIRLLLPAA